MIISEGLQGYNSDNRQADYQKDRAVLQKKGREVKSKVLIYMCTLYKDVYGSDCNSCKAAARVSFSNPLASGFQVRRGTGVSRKRLEHGFKGTAPV